MTVACICRFTLGCSLRSFCFTSSDALAINCWKICLGISVRLPRFTARIESFSERLTKCKNPGSENVAPPFFVTAFTTPLSPLTTRISVTSLGTDFRLEIARRCCWLFDRAFSTKTSVVNDCDCCRIGPAISIESSKASSSSILVGA